MCLPAHYTDLVCAVSAIKPMKIFTAVVGLKRKRPVLVQTLLIHISAAKERSNSIHNFFCFTFCFLSETWNRIWKWTKDYWKIFENKVNKYQIHTIFIFLYFSKKSQFKAFVVHISLKGHKNEMSYFCPSFCLFSGTANPAATHSLSHCIKSFSALWTWFCDHRLSTAGDQQSTF